MESAESKAEAEDRLRHGSSFGAAAAAYDEHRPGYAEAAVRWVLEPVRDRRPVRVADIGAGTGKLTATLVRLGAEVTAVEPDPQMLAELRRAMPAVRSVPGRAGAHRRFPAGHHRHALSSAGDGRGRTGPAARPDS